MGQSKGINWVGGSERIHVQFRGKSLKSSYSSGRERRSSPINRVSDFSNRSGSAGAGQAITSPRISSNDRAIFEVKT